MKRKLDCMRRMEGRAVRYTSAALRMLISLCELAPDKTLIIRLHHFCPQLKPQGDDFFSTGPGYIIRVYYKSLRSPLSSIYDNILFLN